MAFLDRETSEQGGTPILLFHFTRTGKNWYYTNADRDIVFNGATYVSTAISMGAITQSGAAAGDNVKITLPRAVPLATHLDLLTPSVPITVFVRRGHVTEVAATGAFTAPEVADARIIWFGVYAGLARPTPSSRVLSFTPVTLARGGLRLSWSRGCPHALYEQGDGLCNVNKALFETALSSVTVVDGVTIQAAEAAGEEDGWFNAGFIEWEIEAGVVERRGIETHVGDTLTILGGTSNMTDGINFKAYAGCNRGPVMCDGKFGNILNYGGINHLTEKSPFDGDPVF
jgi:hypothetical protein